MKTITLKELEKLHGKIEWLEDPTNYEYVREAQSWSSSTRYKPVKKKTDFGTFWGKLVGICYKKNDNRTYNITYWWLKSYDRSMPDEYSGYAKGGCSPCEAVKIIK